MHGTSQVRGIGRGAPVHMDGYEDDRHTGGRMPGKKVAARLEGMPSRPRIVTVTTDDGMRKSMTITEKGNA